MIAQEAGVNEAILYRHFNSKEELFYASVVEPLRLPVQEFIRMSQPASKRLTRDERLLFMTRVMNSMIDQLTERLPSFGLVLFGGPDTARSFYLSAWEPAIRELAEGWRKIFEDVGLKGYNDPYLSAHVVVGTCLMFALDKRHRGESSPQAESKQLAMCAELARMMYEGVFADGD